MPLQVHISYAAEDETLLEELEVFLQPLLSSETAILCHRARLHGGTDWRLALRQQVATAQVILILVSHAYLNSSASRPWHLELAQAVDLANHGLALLIPILAEDCDWQRGSLGRFVALPKSGVPVRTWLNRDEAWLAVATGISAVLKDWESVAAKMKSVASVSSESAAINKTNLRQVMLQLFSLADFIVLCADLNQDLQSSESNAPLLSADIVGGDSLPMRALNLISWCDQRGYLPELLAAVRRARPRLARLGFTL